MNNNKFNHINTSEIPGELSLVNMISSHVKITSCCYKSSDRHCCSYIFFLKYSDVLLHDRNKIGPSSEISGYLRHLRKSSAYVRQMFGAVRQAFGTILENLRKSSESGRKSRKNVVISMFV